MIVDILASFFDPSNDGFDVLDTAQVVGLVVAIVGLVAMYMRYHARQAAEARAWERQQVKQEILDALDVKTKPIQPGYRNGGDSLSDISMFNRMMLDGQRVTHERLEALTQRMNDHIDNHHREADQ